MDKLPNKTRNDQVEQKLSQLNGLGLGAQMDAHTGYATALASLNVAESLQLLQLQVAESTKENRVALHETTDKLIKSNETLAKSNDRHATAMQWLTAALVVVGIIQIIVAWKSHV